MDFDAYWQDHLGVTYDRLIERLPELLKRRDEIGVSAGRFT